MRIKETMEKYGVKPSKKLGQNFLINKGVADKIIESAHLKTNDIVLEIGPGIGVLTQEIAKKAKKVVAVEKDEKLAQLLRKELQDFKNIEIINGDILKSDISIIGGEYKVVANLPFYISTSVIRKFLEKENGPQEMVLMVQKEVAQRICSKPPKMSILSVSVQVYSKPEILFRVSRGSFFPSPKVDASVIRIKPSFKFLPKSFFKILKAGFSHPRKQLAGNLSKELGIKKEEIEKWLKKSEINPKKRAENLSTEDWIRISQIFPEN